MIRRLDIPALRLPSTLSTGGRSGHALSLSNGTGTAPSPSGQKALGVHALAVELGCSDSTIYALMRTPREEDGSSEGGGILKDAIVSRIGRRIVFDVDKARELAKQSQQR